MISTRSISPLRGGRGAYGCDSLRPTRPMTTSPADTILTAVAGSLKKRMPRVKVPTAPMPVHTA